MPDTAAILRHVDALPALPVVVSEILARTQEAEPHTDFVVDLVESDPAILAAVLKSAQRSARASRATHEKLNAERAVTLLGFAQLRRLALSMGVIKTFDQLPDAGGIGRGDFWTHSMAVACAAELIAKQSGVTGLKSRADEMFCAGLLHDLGKLALCTTLPQTYGRVVSAAKKLRMDINVLEEQIIGLTHAAAGRRLAERWQLDATLTATIGLHHEQPATLARLNLPSGDLLAVHIISVADQLAREMHLGYSGNPALGGSREGQLEALDITERHLEAIGDELVELVQTRCDVMGLGRADAGRLYRESIARANAQLSAAPQQRPGSGRDEAFRKISVIGRELDPAAGLMPTLKLIAASARDAIDDRDLGIVAIVEGGLELLADGDVQHFAGATLPADGERLDVPSANDRVAHRLGDWGAVLAKPDAKLPEELRTGWATLLSIAVRRERHRDAADASREAFVELAKDGDDRVRSAVTEAVAQLAAGAAHELNNPLTVMRGRAELLASRAQDDDQRKAAQTIARQATRLSEMVTDLLRYAQPAEPNAEVTHPRALVAAAIESLRATDADPGRVDALAAACDLPADALPMLNIDGRQLALALAAVFENALLATVDAGTVELDGVCEPDGQSVQIRVRDTGVGMSEQTLRHARDPFFSFQQAGRRRGMGLAIATRLVEAGGGRLDLESRLGRGTCVTISLPVARSGSGRTAA